MKINFNKWISLALLSLAALGASTVHAAGTIGGGAGIVEKQFIQSGTGAVARTFLSKAQDIVNVKDYGAKCDGSTDDTPAFQLAASAVTAALGELRLPRGTCVINGGFTIGQRVAVVGQGQSATVLSFTPAADNTAAITISNGGAVSYQNRLQGFSIAGGGTKIKIGIDAKDTSQLDIEDVAMNTMQNGSIGIQLEGREFTTIKRVEIGYVDYPLRIKVNVHGGIIDCDHLHISDWYSISSAGYHITIDKGVALSNFTIDGDNAMVQGLGAVYWDDTGTGAGTTAAININWSDIRIEGQADSTKYLFYIARSAAYSQNISLKNIYGGLIAKGFYFRNLTDLSLKDIYYVNGSNNEMLNVDSTVWKMNFANVKGQSGTTATLTGQRLLSGTYQVAGSLPDNANYETTTPGVANFAKTYTMGLSVDNTVGRVLRQADLTIQKGTAANSLKCTLTNVWNGDTIAVQDNIVKNATTGQFALDTNGYTLTIKGTGLTGTLVSVISYSFRNSEGVNLYAPVAYVSGSDISFNVKSDNSSTNQDLTALTGTAFIGLTYITSN